VIGVMPRGLTVPREDIDAWVTRIDHYSAMTQDQIRNGAGFLVAIARLKPGVTMAQARADATALRARYRQDHPGAPDAGADARIDVVGLRDSLTEDRRSNVLTVAGAVGLVLLIACANVASLALARATGRAREMAVRAAIGASRGDLLRQLLGESLALSAAGAALGLALAAWTASAMDVRLDLTVLAFCVGLTLVTAVLFGLAPALQASRPDLNVVLREGGHGAIGGGRRHRARSLLVAGQMALSMALLVVTGLLARSFREVERVPPGFDPHNALTMRIALPPARYPDDARRSAFVRDTLARFEALPGVRSAAASLSIPMSVGVMAPFLAEGQAVVPIPQRPLAEWKAITPAYFTAMGIPLRRGRAFAWSDDASAPRRVIVSESLAKRFFGEADPIGRRITYARREVVAEIVGVAADVRNRGLEAEGAMIFYTPYPQFAWPNLSLTIRTAGDPRSFENAARAQVFASDRDLPVTAMQTLDDAVAGALAQRRQTLWLIGGFAAVALLLAVIGLYGAMSYAVAQRTAEFGVRQAIGAARSDILRLVLADGLRVSLAGIAAGTAAAWAATRLIAGMLFHVPAVDPLTFGAVAIVLAAVALAASWLPARRATRVDPLTALRGR
jgi:predicted permease